MRKTSFTTLFRLQYSQQIMQFIAGMLLAVGIVTFRLSQLLPGVNSLEHKTINSGRTIAAIRQDPINLPYKVAVWLAHKLDVRNPTNFRYISIAIGLFCLIVFFIVVRRWFGFWVSAVSSLMLLTSSWFLHLIRLAAPDVGQLSVMVLIGFGLWLKSHRWPYAALVVGVGLTALSLYVPGLFWIMLIGIIHQRHYIARTMKQTKWLMPLASIMLAALLAPLIWQTILSPKLALTVFGLPTSLDAAKAIFGSLVSLPSHLFWHGPNDASLWLPGTPLLDYLSAVLAVLGLYNFVQYRQLDRSKLTLGFLLAGLVLSVLTSSTLLGFLLPIVYILIASGLAFMINQWLTVFPRNPFARGLMIVLIALAVSSVSYYQLSHYFLAWARHPETRASFKP